MILDKVGSTKRSQVNKGGGLISLEDSEMGVAQGINASLKILVFYKLNQYMSTHIPTESIVSVP